VLGFICQYLCEKPIVDKDVWGDCWIQETAQMSSCQEYKDVNPDVSTHRSISNPQLEPRWKECGPADRNFLISSCYYCYYYYYCCDRDCFSNVELYYSQLETWLPGLTSYIGIRSVNYNFHTQVLIFLHLPYIP